MDLKRVLFLLPAIVLCYTPLQAQTRRTKTNSRKSAFNLNASITRGKAVFTQYCVTCHQADGMGVSHLNPPLVNTTYVLDDKARLIKIVLNGFNEDVEINGESYANSMTAHDFLKDYEIADVLTYVRNSFGNKAGVITAALVKTTRAANKKT